MLNLGHFDIGSDLRTATQVTGNDLSEYFRAEYCIQLTGAAANFKTKLANLNSVPGGDFVPLLSSPSSVFKLMIGQDVNLFTYGMPTLAGEF